MNEIFLSVTVKQWVVIYSETALLVGLAEVVKVELSDKRGKFVVAEVSRQKSCLKLRD